MPSLRIRSWLLMVVLIVVVPAAACGETALPGTNGNAVIAYLDDVNYQESWDLWPGLGEKYQGDEPHGMLLTTYVNAKALEAVNSNASSMPDGAIIVKENYTPAGVLAATTVMYKKSGYDSEHNDWFWLKYLADGTIEKQGKVEGCQNCHGDVKDNDYVWTGI